MNDIQWLSIVLITMFIAGMSVMKLEARYNLGIKALQAQVDKKHCPGEVTFPEMIGEK